MKEKALTVEFRLPPTGTAPAPKPLPGEKAERLRQERAARRARQLALAHYIDGLIRSGRVRDLATVARMCGVSRARVSQVILLLEVAADEGDALLSAFAKPVGSFRRASRPSHLPKNLGRSSIDAADTVLVA